MAGLTDFESNDEGESDDENVESLKVMTLEYKTESKGHRLTEPVVQLFCRDASGDRRYVEVEGYYPFFYITESEFEEKQNEILNENVIRSIEAREEVVADENQYNQTIDFVDEPMRTLQDEKLVRIYTIIPQHVGDIKGSFDKTYEADVFFTDRFLISNEIMEGIKVPEGTERVDVEEIEPAGDDTPDLNPRTLTIDIEVWSGTEFPSTEHAEKPITCVTTHDSYTDAYRGWMLHPDAVSNDEYGEANWGTESPDWELPDGVGDDQITIDVFHDEAEMLADVNDWIIEHDPDLLTGWNSSQNDIGSGFDYPYWINRCYSVNAWSVEDLSPTDTTFVSKRGNAVIGGRQMFDMLQAYKKTQIHEKRSYSLGYIADEELGYGKEDIDDLDEGWLNDPVDFMKYNIRDVGAVVGIESEKNVLEMYDHIRSISGSTYDEILESNIGIIDVLFMRRANSDGVALPTSVRPDVQHYWGAYVFPPEPGLHEHVVYPDLSSLYPNLFRDMNASPETIVGFEDDLRESQYTKEDCQKFYVDTRDESEKYSADSPERTPFYVLKPEVKESFVRETIQELIDMKYEYKKDEYSDEAYEAVKRITNSVYGVMGDSKTYGTGFRLFDWRIAEGITLAGRDVIRHTADEFEKYVNDAGYTSARIIAGDTDSCVCTIPDADSMEEVLEIALEAAEYVNSTYDDLMRDRFMIEDGNMEVEIEKYAKSALFMDKKKRYALWILWDEGDEEDEVEVKGFESVRSDSARITEEVQEESIEKILKEDDPQQAVREYLKPKWDKVCEGEVSLEQIGTPSKIKNKLMDYGWSDDEVESGDTVTTIEGERLDTGRKYMKFYTPQPHIRGARYANAHIEGEEIGEGDKPLMYYVDRMLPNRGYPEVYDYEDEFSLNNPDYPPVDEPGMYEIDREVDALAVSDPDNVPDAATIDYEKMAEKTIKDPIEPIADVLGWEWDDIVSESEQTGLQNFM